MITECAECAVKHDCFKLPPLQNYPLLGGGNNLFLVGDLHVWSFFFFGLVVLCMYIFNKRNLEVENEIRGNGIKIYKMKPFQMRFPW